MPDLSTLLPLQNPISIFAVALVVFLVVPLVLERLRVPGLVGLVLAGAIIGPNGLGILERDSTFELLGRVGLLYIFFLAALEIDLKEFARNRRNSVLFGLMSFLVPQVLGAVLAVWILDFDWITAILLGSMFGSHTLLAYPVASRMGIARSRIVTTGVGGTIMTDSLAILVLAVVAASQRGTLGPVFWIVLVASIVIYVGLVFTLVPWMARLFFKRARAGGVADFLFVATMVYGCAALAPLAQLEQIIGAFLAGFALNKFVPHSGSLMRRIDFLGQSLFIPFFLVATGMLVDVSVFVEDPSSIGVALFMMVAVTGTKFLAAAMAKGFLHFTKAEMFVLFGLTVPQAAATLAAVIVGVEIGLLGPAVLNGAIMMILVTCLVGPLAIQRHGAAVAAALAEADARSPEAPQRLLVPLSNPHTAAELVGLALVLREPGSTEPLLPLGVVPEEAGVAMAERLLLSAVMSAAEADAPTDPLTRFDRNPASGILRAAGETRASDILIGWNGQRSPGRAIFGGVIDQVLDGSTQQVHVARLRQPLPSIHRLLVVLPTSLAYHPGFYHAVQSVKRLSVQLGATIHVLSVRTDLTHAGKALKRAGLAVDFTSDESPDWGEVESRARRELQADDLVVLLASRRNAIAHTRAMDRLPQALAATEASFMVIYPTNLGAAAPPVTATALPDFLAARNILFDPFPDDFEGVVRDLVATEFPAGTATHREAVDGLLKDEFAIALLRDSRIILAHARVRGLREARLLLALRPGGIRHPQSEVSTHVAAVLLFPQSYPAQAHLAMLARVAQLFSSKPRVEALRHVTTMDEFMSWLHLDPPPAPPPEGE